MSQEACLLAAVISAPRRAFACPPGKKRESLACVRGFSQSSDTLAAFVACQDFEGWKAARGEGFAERWAGDLFLVPKRLKQLLAARDMHHEELRRAGLATRARPAAAETFRLGRAATGAPWWTADDSGRGEAAAEALDDGAGFGGEDGVLVPDGGEEIAGRNAGSGLCTGSEVGRGLELVTALLVAAYPQNLALRRRLGLARHNTATGLDAIIAPQSVNAPSKGKPVQTSSALGPRGEGEMKQERITSWWSYASMQISNRQGFLRATTLVDACHVALFGGLSTYEDSSGALREVDGWVELRGTRGTLRCLARLRGAMSRSVHLRVLDPGRPLPVGSQALLREVASILHEAAARQERIAASLPDAPVQHVERPPPPAARPAVAPSWRGGAGGQQQQQQRAWWTPREDAPHAPGDGDISERPLPPPPGWDWPPRGGGAHASSGSSGWGSGRGWGRGGMWRAAASETADWEGEWGGRGAVARGAAAWYSGAESRWYHTAANDAW